MRRLRPSRYISSEYAGPGIHNSMNRSRLLAISFDCYGTLIDWEAGIIPVIKNLLAKHGHLLSGASILELFGEYEAEAESGPYRTYREVLESVVGSFAHKFNFDASDAELRSLHESIPNWRPFADTVQALRQLQKTYKLVIISNIDDELFAETRKHLAVEFDAVITAQQARSYKPSLNNFQLALRALAIAPDQLLHAAQSVYHDVVPAKSLGIATAWVNRHSARPGVGAVTTSIASDADKKADLEVPDLVSLVKALQL